MSTTPRVTSVLTVALVGACLVAEPATAQLSVPPSPIRSYDGDPGKPGDPASWRTAEFLRDNGMLSIGAEFAYAAGYAGQGSNIGMVDSGTYKDHVREHGSYDNNYTVADRFLAVVAQGGTTGPTDGFVNPAFNDTHGTHVSGTIAASRDGLGEPTQPTNLNMHGVGFNLDLYSGNTAKTDGVLYGKWPTNVTAAQKPDNAYIGNVYRAVAAAQTRQGGPIRLITSSWGSRPTTEHYGFLETPLPPNTSIYGLNAAARYLTLPEGVADADGNTSHWANGMMEVARAGTLIQITAGNNGFANPTARAALPYYYPDLEPTFYTTSGINPGTGRTFNPDGSVLVPGTQQYNLCGVARWTCVTAPGTNISSTYWAQTAGVLRPTYATISGTSMAGPHSAAVLALVLQRFPYMTNTQAMHTMFTTGRQNATIGPVESPAAQNPTRGQIVQIPDLRNGWGTVSLREVMRGPGQLLGPTTIDTKGFSDVWSLDISDVAIRARQAEDAAEATAWAQKKIDRGWTNGVPDTASDQDKFDYATGVRREQARDARVYVGSLTKSGAGTLFLTGGNTWHGPSTVRGGKLSIVGSHASPIAVDGGTLGGSGTVAGGINVGTGTLHPGLAPDEAARITDVTVAPGNVLNAGGDVRISEAGRLVATVRSATDYSKLRAAGDLVLGGQLVLDLQGAVPPGNGLTIATGRSVTGTFAGLPEGAFVRTAGQVLRVSYLNNSVTLTTAIDASLPVGGTVPATLSLTLGTPASFGAFTPGVMRTYFATTTANVISTAGDALLSVADPSSTGTGHLVNGSFVLPQPLQARARNAANTGTAYNNVGSSASPLNLLTWSAPISNDAVSLEFSQLVNANDPLRTGTYNKTLTFTLSTTNP